MSLILEALRKSEAERQREGAPSVAMELPPVPARGAGATPRWVWPTLAIVVAGAILAGWWGMRTGRSDPAPAAVAGATFTEPPPPTLAAPPAPAMRPAPMPVPPQVQPPVLSAAPAAAVASPPPAAPAPHPAARMPPPATSAPAAAAAPATVSAEDSEDAPPISATGLPPVKLSMHMWDADPARRFVILDGQRLGEGDRNGGLQVIAIRRDGVIVERGGIRARVPLP